MTTAHTQTRPVETIVPNALARYYQGLSLAAASLDIEHADIGIGDSVPRQLALPPLTDPLTGFLASSELSLYDLGERAGRRIVLLNLMRNPRTRTTKTFGSLGITLRAVAHIQRTGERVLLLTPTSGNKGTALRDAVGRAVAAGLVGPDQLRVVTVTPTQSRDKLRTGNLSEDPELRRCNPAVLAEVAVPVGVKELARTVADGARAAIRARGWQLWYTLGLDNYRIADAVRAFVEAEFLPRTGTRPRVHAHAVSGAWGLLGYDFGLQVIERNAERLGVTPVRPQPGFFLVQHLATPEMILSQAGRGTDPSVAPQYRFDEAVECWTQHGDPLFPEVTDDPHERLDATFYTPNPPTIPVTDRIIHSRGGGGVVVSRRECLRYYEQIRALTAPFGIDVPADPAALREWSLVMVLTGVLVGVERGLLPADAEVVVHGTGSYSDASLPPLPKEQTRLVRDAGELAALLEATVAGEIGE